MDTSDVPYEVLLSIREQVGSKTYTESVKTSKRNSRAGSGSSTITKRANKNRPTEISSKSKILPKEGISTAKSRGVKNDPRFDPRCGAFDKSIFHQTYGFVDQVREDELNLVSTKLKSADSIVERKKLNELMSRLTQKSKAREREKLVQQKTRTFKHELRRKYYPKYTDGTGTNKDNAPGLTGVSGTKPAVRNKRRQIFLTKKQSRQIKEEVDTETR